MTYYSGTSRFAYDSFVKIDEIGLFHTIREIHCFETTGNDFGLELAIGWAIKRAVQDESVPVVIEITRPEDFQLKPNHTMYPVLIGNLKPENHIIHTVDELPVSEYYKTRARELTDKFKEKK